MEQCLELGFIGFGLIGGSIARSLKKNAPGKYRIKVYSRRENPHLQEGVEQGVIDRIVYTIGEEFSACDVIFLCAPVLKNVEYLTVLKPFLRPNCILTDVGSVKGNICRAAADAGLAQQFIGGHPMAGSEKTGYENSTDCLLENAYYLLTPNEKNAPGDIERMQRIVGETGANCVVIDSKEHDRITAAISHVPHIIAVTLVNMVSDHEGKGADMREFAAGGFRDITRIASSSPAMWQDICLANGDAIQAFLRYFKDQLEDFCEMIDANDSDRIYEQFERAGEYRSSIPEKKSSVIGRSYELFINIDDRTGAIAAVATVLSASGISIKNIGIIHNREYADGVLRLELYSEKDAAGAREVLCENHYAVLHRD